MSVISYLGHAGPHGRDHMSKREREFRNASNGSSEYCPTMTDADPRASLASYTRGYTRHEGSTVNGYNPLVQWEMGSQAEAKGGYPSYPNEVASRSDIRSTATPHALPDITGSQADQISRTNRSGKAKLL